MGCGDWPHAQPPTWRTSDYHLVWPLPFDLPAKVVPAGGIPPMVKLSRSLRECLAEFFLKVKVCGLRFVIFLKTPRCELKKLTN